jgi:peptide/nickel transport system permease protein
MKNKQSKRVLWAALGCLGLLHCAVIFAGFAAPCGPTSQDRDLPFAPPTRVHLIDAFGRLHRRPFIYAWTARQGGAYQYEEDRNRPLPLHFLVRGPEYKVAGLFRSDLHLFGVESPARIFLAGSDNYGRDQFARILYGGRVSLAAGVFATGVTLLLGLVLGTLSGFYGGWIDESIMRVAELFLVLPWLYLLLAVRAFLPLHLSSVQTFYLLVGVIGTIGWARPARLVRGIVLSAKTRTYVMASHGFGASNVHILRRHILPHTYGILLTQAALLVPKYVVAEVTLSFFGLGLSEPFPSWGNLLASLQHYNVLVSYWWMFVPGLTLTVFSLGYLAVAHAAQGTLQSASI